MIRGINSILLNSPGAQPICINLTQKRTSFYNKYRHGPTKISNPTPDYIGWVKASFGREGIEWFKEEVARIVKKPFRKLPTYEYPCNKTIIFEHFDTDESVKGWKPVADSDSLNGFSTSSIVRSPAGHGLFKGVLDTKIPDDGLTQNSGFAGVIGPRKPRDGLMSIQEYWDWSKFNCIEMKVRGDGRKYGLTLNIGDYNDDGAYYDCFFHPFYTRGGPYWQTIRIPLSKFVFANKAFIQDEQGALPKFRIKFVAFVLMDTYSGPFHLEIDYIGLRREILPFQEITAYEAYSFSHLKYRQLQVDCQVPEPH